MHPDKIDKLNGVGVILRFVHPAVFAIISSLILFILAGFKSDLSGLKADLFQAKIEAKSNFDKLGAVAQVNFDKMDGQFNNHLAHHQQFDKEIFERLSCIETKIKK
jgi:hypothetical protein